MTQYSVTLLVILISVSTKPKILVLNVVTRVMFCREQLPVIAFQNPLVLVVLTSGVMGQFV